MKMPENTQSTAELEPVDASTTSGSVPEASEQSSTTTPAQPSSDELQARMKRLEDNLKGQAKQTERERAERERLQAQLEYMQRATPPAPQQSHPQQTEPEYEQEFDQLYDAVLNQDKKKGAEILKRNAERPLNRFGQVMQQADFMQRQQASANQYLEGVGLRPGTPMFDEVNERLRAAQNDPRYAFLGGNQAALAAIITNEVRADGKKAKAKEEAREDAVDTAAGSAPAGKQPGTPTTSSNKMYFNAAEQDYIAKLAKRDNVELAEAKKRYWSRMDAGTKEARQKAGRA
jgi:hypothetical protein